MTAHIDFHYSTDCYEGEYRGFNIEAKHCDQPENPWVMWDCNTPMLSISGRHRNITEHAEGDNIQDPLEYYTEGQLSRHWKALCKILDLKVKEIELEVRENVECQNAEHFNEERRRIFDDTLYSLKPSYYQNASDYIDAIADMFNLIGIHAVSTSASGYSQGDYAYLLFVLTPEHRKRCGFSKASEDKLFKEWFETDENLWAAWAFGDVYYFDVIKDGAIMHSGGEYYGTDHVKSYLDETARMTVDFIIEDFRQKKTNRLKQLIANKVSILQRPTILNQIPYRSDYF
ncbi:MAG: hypothetical protein COA43_00510 [Robiginitomaculum sp.]|nr:MAG: hypothetical protein COA43_00510 [Robiginitomaculum sp.]